MWNGRKSSAANKKAFHNPILSKLLDVYSIAWEESQCVSFVELARSWNLHISEQFLSPTAAPPLYYVLKHFRHCKFLLTRSNCSIFEEEVSHNGLRTFWDGRGKTHRYSPLHRYCPDRSVVHRRPWDRRCTGSYTDTESSWHYRGWASWSGRVVRLLESSDEITTNRTR